MVATRGVTKRFDAVLFDFGGVVGTSPLEVFRTFESSSGLPHRFLSSLMTTAPDTNAWAQMERGELEEATFYALLEQEAEALGGKLDARAFVSLMRIEVRPEMVAAIRALKQRGYQVSCLTNNMSVGHGTAMSPTPEDAAAIADVMTLFDHVIESRHVKSRKPEPRIYQHAIDVMQVDPSRIVFLDDLGINLKAAKALGMATIKVADPHLALVELSTLLGHPLTATQ